MRYPTADLIRSHLISCDLIECRAIRCLIERADVMTPQKGPPAVEKHEHDLRSASILTSYSCAMTKTGESQAKYCGLVYTKLGMSLQSRFKQMHSKMYLWCKQPVIELPVPKMVHSGLESTAHRAPATVLL